MMFLRVWENRTLETITLHHFVIINVSLMFLFPLQQEELADVIHQEAKLANKPETLV